jgi:hypothetical protein
MPELVVPDPPLTDGVIASRELTGRGAATALN